MQALLLCECSVACSCDSFDDQHLVLCIGFPFECHREQWILAKKGACNYGQALGTVWLNFLCFKVEISKVSESILIWKLGSGKKTNKQSNHFCSSHAAFESDPLCSTRYVSHVVDPNHTFTIDLSSFYTAIEATKMPIAGLVWRRFCGVRNHSNKGTGRGKRWKIDKRAGDNGFDLCWLPLKHCFMHMRVFFDSTQPYTLDLNMVERERHAKAHRPEFGPTLVLSKSIVGTASSWVGRITAADCGVFNLGRIYWIFPKKSFRPRASSNFQ